MRELNVNEVKEVNGGFVWSMPRIIMGGIGAYRMISSLNWANASHNSNNRGAATNRL
jgi:hypothetical protein